MDMNKLLIVHGYSDRSDSFTELANLLRRENLYHDIRSIDYDSIDDEATFQDYADRLDDIYRTEYGDSERIDVLCHSTGSLVVRAWLALRRQRQLRYAELTRTEPVLDVPVERLYMFAPANFGSDIAKLGQSFWNRISSL
jgi:alpha-beta hydrolase superfamily lysophospholipase